MHTCTTAGGLTILMHQEQLQALGQTFVSCPCRYSSKEALTEIHQQSAPFKKFKEQFTAANLEFASKTGESYYEEDLGFM